MSSIYTSGNDQYFYSNKIKVFPCAYRNSTYDASARLNTEYNFTHLPHTVDKASYIIEFTSKKLICVIKGYYFEIELDDSDSENKDSDKLENNYLNICVASPSSSNGDNFVEGPHLCSWESSNIEDTLDIKQGSDTFFSGLKISSGEALSKDTYKCYALKLGASAKLPIMANKIENSAGTGKPISQEFTTEILSATTIISTPDLRVASDKLTVNSGKITANVPVTINNTLEVKDSTATTSILKAESEKVTINKPTSIEGTNSNLTVAGTGTFGGKLTVTAGGASITGATILKGTVGITGKTTIGTSSAKTEIENNKITTAEITADKINIEKASGTGSLVIDKKQNNIIEIKNSSDELIFSVDTASGETYAKKINVATSIAETPITDIFGSTVSAIDELKLKTINPGKASYSGNPIKIVVGADSNTAVKFYNDANKSIVKADTFEGNATTASYIEVKDTDNNTIFKADSENNKVYASNLSSISADLGEVTAGAIKSRNYNGSEVIAWDKYSEGLTYTTATDDNGEYAIVAGIGTCTDTEVVIPATYNGKPVTRIGNSAFSSYTSLTSVTIPDSVTSIGNLAFRYCWSLTSVTIGNGVTSIGDSAFRECTSLKSVTIGSGVTSIGDSAFEDCTSLKSITIPDGVTNIGNYAFHSCSNLKDVYYGGTESKWSAISIGLYNTSLTNATIYYYSETEPIETGNYWHYGSDGFKISCDDELMIDSENFKVTQNGQIVANSGTIGGLILSKSNELRRYKTVGPLYQNVLSNSTESIDASELISDEIVEDLSVLCDTNGITAWTYYDETGDSPKWWVNFRNDFTYPAAGITACFYLTFKTACDGSYLKSEDDSFVLTSANYNATLVCDDVEIKTLNSQTVSAGECKATSGLFGDIEIKNTILQCNDTTVNLNYINNSSTATTYKAKLSWESNKITVNIYNSNDKEVKLTSKKEFSVSYSTNGKKTVYNTCFITVYEGQSTGSVVVPAFLGVHDAFFVPKTENGLRSSEMDFQGLYENSFISFNKTLIPTVKSVDDVTGFNLGNNDYLWNTVYARTSTISSSDRNVKNTIQPLTEAYTQIFDALKPVSYKFNVSNNNRTHMGLIAQDVKEAVESAGITTQDFAGYCEWEKEDGTTGCGLRYSEFIAMCINEIQKLKKRVNELEVQQND